MGGPADTGQDGFWPVCSYDELRAGHGAAALVHGHAFDLRTGQCLDEEGVRVACYQVRVVDGTVLVGPRRVVTA